MLPERVDCDGVIELATMTVMNRGTLDGGLELFPPVVFHVPPHVAGPGVVEPAQPLKLRGAGPPLNELLLAHWAPQNITFCPTLALRSPMTNLVIGPEGAEFNSAASASD
jgi:hypothetical protein